MTDEEAIKKIKVLMKKSPGNASDMAFNEACKEILKFYLKGTSKDEPNS